MECVAEPHYRTRLAELSAGGLHKKVADRIGGVSQRTSPRAAPQNSRSTPQK